MRICKSMYRYIYTYLCVYICKVQMLRSCRLQPHESREVWQQHGWRKTKKTPNPNRSASGAGNGAAPISAAAPGTAIYGHGAAGAGADRCGWRGCMALLRPGRGPAPCRDAAASRQPAPPVTWCSAPPVDSQAAGLSGCCRPSPLSRPGKRDPLHWGLV